MELTRGKISVELEYIGEGWGGDFNDNDPEDTPLLRFTVYRLVNGEQGQIDDASYCTQLPEDLPDKKKKKALEIIMDRLSDLDGFDEGFVDHSIKKVCEELSWISPKELEEPCPTSSS